MKFARISVAAALFASLLGFQGTATASYPTRPVHVVVPFSAGGALDTIARAITQKMSEQTGNTFVVENRAGASGNIGAQAVARSQPDGYNLLFTSATTAAITSFMYTKGVGYELNKDLVPVAMAAQLPVVLISSQKSGIKTAADLIKASEKDGGVTFGSAGAGSIEHVTGELFMRTANVKMLHVPYKGGADALRDVSGGQIDIVFATGGGMFEAMRANLVNGVAVASAKRAPIRPDLPTLQEEGLKDFESSVIYGFFAPEGLPANVQKTLENAIAEALKDPAVIERLAAQSGEVSFADGETARKLVQGELDKWGAIVREANIKAD